jgi:solute carrier family 25 (mitochondrial oxoglutarate transporter), member 11
MSNDNAQPVWAGSLCFTSIWAFLSVQRNETETPRSLPSSSLRTATQQFTTHNETQTNTHSQPMTQEKKKVPFVPQLAIAGVSGCLAWCLTHPFENLKNRIVKAEPHTPLMQTVRETCNSGFYKGLSGGIYRQIVYATVRLGCYEPFRDCICSDPANPSILERAAAGASAGAFASVLTSPIEVCLVLQTSSAEKVSFASAGKRVLEQSGIAGFWRGIGPLMARATVVGICQVAMYDQCSTFLRKHNVEKKRNWSPNMIFCMASGFTAIFYSIITMPIELARIKMSSQLGNGKLKYRNVPQTVMTVVREEGVLAVYDSFLPYASRCSIHTISCFFIMEVLAGAYWRKVRGVGV